MIAASTTLAEVWDGQLRCIPRNEGNGAAERAIGGQGWLGVQPVGSAEVVDRRLFFFRPA